jgi:hypothetical protein
MSMNDQARKKLCDVIANYGSTICSTPRTCVMVLGQQCAEFPAEKDLLLRALERGAVAGVIKAPVGGPWDDEIKTVAGSSVKPADARWAVESWAIALGKHPDAAPLPPEPVMSINAPPDAVRSGGVVRTAGSTLAVAIGGGIGGAFTSMVLTMVLIVLAVEVPGFPTGLTSFMAFVIVVMLGVIGGIGSGVGAGLGWTVIQTQSSALSLSTEQLNRRLRKGFMSAMIAAMVGTAIPGYFFGLPGMVVGGFLGGLSGAVSGGLAGAAGGLSRNY